MLRFFLMMVLFLLCFVRVTYAQEAFPMKESINKISLPAHASELVLRLPANPSTGFTWILVTYNPLVFQVLNHDYKKTSKNLLMGAPGIEEWRFRIKAPKLLFPISTITLIYARPWDISSTTIEKKTLIIV